MFQETRKWILTATPEYWRMFWNWRKGESQSPERGVITGLIVIHANENLAARAA